MSVALTFPFSAHPAMETHQKASAVEELTAALAAFSSGDLPDMDGLLERRELIADTAFTAATSLATMMAIRRVLWLVKPERGMPDPTADLDLRQRLEIVLAGVPLSVSERQAFSSAMLSRYAYINLHATAEADLITHILIPDTIREARLLMNDEPESPIDLATATASFEAAPEVRLLADLYSSMYRMYGAADRSLITLSGLLDGQRESHSFAKSVAEHLNMYKGEVFKREHMYWMTDEGAAVSVGATLGINEAPEQSDDGTDEEDAGYVHRSAREQVADRAKIVLSIMRTLQDRTGANQVSLPEIMAFSKTEDFESMLPKTAAERTAGSLLSWLDSL